LTVDQTPKLCLRIDAACDTLGIGRSSLYRLINEKKLRAIKIAGRTLIPMTELVRVTSEPGAPLL
jgi:excisionase family DNA binding protein